MCQMDRIRIFSLDPAALSLCLGRGFGQNKLFEAVWTDQYLIVLLGLGFGDITPTFDLLHSLFKGYVMFKCFKHNLLSYVK